MTPPNGNQVAGAVSKDHFVCNGDRYAALVSADALKPSLSAIFDDSVLARMPDNILFLPLKLSQMISRSNRSGSISEGSLPDYDTDSSLFPPLAHDHHNFRSRSYILADQEGPPALFPEPIPSLQSFIHNLQQQKTELPARSSASSTSSQSAQRKRTLETSIPIEQRRMFPCSHAGCAKVFVRMEHLNRHLRIHTGERRFVCTHEHCQKRFNRCDELARHMKIHKRPPPPTA